MSNLVDHARRELELIGEEPATIDWYLEVIAVFASFGHSGGSASVAIPTINRLLQFENLSELTNSSEEWMNVADKTIDRGPLWQNVRNPEAFSHDGGKHYYLLSEGGNDTNPKPLHTSKKARKS